MLVFMGNIQRHLLLYFIGNMYIFSLMFAADKIWNTELTLIHKNSRSVRNSHAQVNQSVLLKTHYDVTDKTITSVLKVSTDVIRNITACPIGLVEILAIMSVSTFKIAVILY